MNTNKVLAAAVVTSSAVAVQTEKTQKDRADTTEPELYDLQTFVVHFDIAEVQYANLSSQKLWLPFITFTIKPLNIQMLGKCET